MTTTSLYMNEPFGMVCAYCGKPNSLGSIDTLHTECRKKLYAENPVCCGGCGKKYEEGMTGWYVPSCGSYSNISYYCPEHLEKIRQSKIRAELKIEALQSLIAGMKRQIKDSNEYVEQWSPKANT